MVSCVHRTLINAAAHEQQPTKNCARVVLSALCFVYRSLWSTIEDKLEGAGGLCVVIIKIKKRGNTKALEYRY